MTVTYLCRHDDHDDCPAPTRCGCSCHRQLTIDDTLDETATVLQLALDLALLDDLRHGRLSARVRGQGGEA